MIKRENACYHFSVSGVVTTTFPKTRLDEDASFIATNFGNKVHGFPRSWTLQRTRPQGNLDVVVLGGLGDPLLEQRSRTLRPEMSDGKCDDHYEDEGQRHPDDDNRLARSAAEVAATTVDGPQRSGQEGPTSEAVNAVGEVSPVAKGQGASSTLRTNPIDKDAEELPELKDSEGLPWGGGASGEKSDQGFYLQEF